MYPQVANLVNDIMLFFEEHKEKITIENSEQAQNTITGLQLYKKITSIVKKDSGSFVDTRRLDDGFSRLLSRAYFVNPTDEAIAELHSKFIALNKNLGESTIIYIVAGSLYECSWGQLSTIAVQRNFSDEVSEAFEKYSIIRNTLDLIAPKVDSLLQRKSRETLARFNNKSNEKIEELISAQEFMNKKTLEEETKKQIKEAKDQISHYMDQVGATLVVEDAHKLWKNKSKSHKIMFAFSSLFFALIVLTSIGIPVFFWSDLSREIKELDQLFTNHVFGGVLLLLIPVLGVAWILRLVSRFTIQNMTLADDAEIRKVMAETYVKLVSQRGAMDPNDRAIILTALFRPLPGSHGEDVAPPSIADVVKQNSTSGRGL